MKEPYIYKEQIVNLTNQIGRLLGFEGAVLWRRNKNGEWYNLFNKWDSIGPDTAMIYPSWGIPEWQNYAVHPVGVDPNREPSKFLTIFGIYTFPGCCAFCISTGAGVMASYQHKGVNKLGIQLRQAIAAFTGYTALICTDVTAHPYSIRTIEGAGFRNLAQVSNRRTRRLVNLYFKELE